MKKVLQFGLMLAVSASAWAQGAKPLAFDVVSVKASKPDAEGSSWGPKRDGVHMENLSLVSILEWAYSMHNVRDDQVIGVPGWAKGAHYDLDAKVAPEDVAAFKRLSAEERDAMLLAALEDRFKLKAHTETREMPVYNLVIAKGGAKLKEADAAKDSAQGILMKDRVVGSGAYFTNMHGDTFVAEFHACGLERLVPILTEHAEKTVIDKTGLTGKYDMKVEWTPHWVKDETAATAPRLLTALPEQLGLKLEPGKGPVTVLVVEHVEQPSAN